MSPNLARRLVAMVCVATVLASLAAGMPFFLRRVGALAPVTHSRELALFCHQPIHPWWLPGSCGFRRVLPGVPAATAKVDPQRFYRQLPAERPLRLARHGLLLALAAGSALSLFGRHHQPPSLRRFAPALPLLVSTVAAWAMGAAQAGVWPALHETARQAHWLLLLPLVGWLATPFAFGALQRTVAALLILQLPFGLLEAMRAVPLPFGTSTMGLGPFQPPVPGRLAMAFTMPNTLGVMASLGLAFCRLGNPPRWRWLLAPVLLIVGLARSGAGLVLVLFQLLAGSPRRLLLGLVALALGALLLPHLLGRPDIYNSLTGRLSYGLSATRTSGLSLLIGQGLSPINHQATDSLAVRLLIQQGLLGGASFYGLLLLCIARSRAHRPFLLAVLIASLVAEITTVFPLSLLLAVVVHRSLLGSAPDRMHHIATTQQPAAVSNHQHRDRRLVR